VAAKREEQPTRLLVTSCHPIEFPDGNPLSFLALLDGGMKWNGKLQFPIPFHTAIQQREFFSIFQSTFSPMFLKPLTWRVLCVRQVKGFRNMV